MIDRRQYLIHYNYDPPLTFTAKSANASVILTKIGNPTVTGLRYKTNNNPTWQTYIIDTPIELTNIGDYVQFWNINTVLNNGSSNYVQFNINNGLIEASGNIMSLYNYLNNVPNYGFYYLFGNCTTLLTPPKLPAITIKVASYAHMFRRMYIIKKSTGFTSNHFSK